MSSNNLKHADIAKLQELKLLLGDDYGHLISTFLTNSGKSLKKLQELCDTDRDADQIARLAHSLKGTAGNIGAVVMHKYAIQLEKLAKENDLAVLPELLAEIDNAFYAFRRVVLQKAS